MASAEPEPRSRGSALLASPIARLVDSVLQTFENCRPALSDRMIAEGVEGAERFFAELYDKERARLAEAVALHDPHLPEDRRRALIAEMDALLEKVMIPAYARLALRFTTRERNDF